MYQIQTDSIRGFSSIRTIQNSFNDYSTLILNRRQTTNRYQDVKQHTIQEIQSFQLFGNPMYPKKLKALKNVKDVRSIENQLIILWVGSSKDILFQYRNFVQLYQTMNTNTKAPFISYVTPDKVKQQIQARLDKNSSLFVQIWVSDESILKSLREVEKIEKFRKKYHIVYFNPQDPQPKRKLEQMRKNKIKQWKNVLYATNDFLELSRNYYSCNAIPNFLFQSQQQPVINCSKMTLQNIIKSDNQENQSLIEKSKEIILSKISKQRTQQVEQFIKMYKSGKLESLIEYYKSQKFFYRYFNSSSKIWIHPFQIYYNQPFIKMMFQQIKSGYSKLKTQINGDLIFYRGCLLHQQQYQLFKNNVKKFIYSLGVLSTSSLKKVAQVFAINTIITIRVPYAKRHEKFDYGFCDAENKEQAQFIFNCLSHFRIQKVGIDKNGRYDIQLVYGELSQAMYLNQNQIKEIPERLNDCYQYICKLVKAQNRIMQDCSFLNNLIKNGMYQTAIKFCQKKVQYVSKNCQDKQILFQCQKQLLNTYLVCEKPEKVIDFVDQQFLTKKDAATYKCYGQCFELMGAKTDNDMQKKQYFTKAENYLKQSLYLIGYELQKRSSNQIQKSNETKSLSIKKPNVSKQEQNRLNFIISVLDSLSSVKYFQNDMEEARKYSSQSISVCYKKGNQDKSFLEAQIFKHFNRFKHSISLCSQIMDFMNQIQFSQGKQVPLYISCKLYMVLIYLQKFSQSKNNDFREKANASLKQAQQLYSNCKKPFTISQKAQYYLKIALVHTFLNKNIKKALYCFQQSLKCFQTEYIKNQQSIAFVHSQIGELLISEIPERAKQQLNQSLLLYEDLNNKVFSKGYAKQMIYILPLLIWKFPKEDVDTRIVWIKKAIKLIELNKIDKQHHDAYLYLQLARIYLDVKKNIQKAKEIVQKYKQNNNILKIIEVGIQLKQQYFSKAYCLMKTILANQSKFEKYYGKTYMQMKMIQIKNQYIKYLSHIYNAQLKGLFRNKNYQQVLYKINEEYALNYEEVYEILGNKELFFKLIFFKFESEKQMENYQQAIQTIYIIAKIDEKELMKYRYNYQRVNQQIQQLLNKQVQKEYNMKKRIQEQSQRQSDYSSKNEGRASDGKISRQSYMTQQQDGGSNYNSLSLERIEQKNNEQKMLEMIKRQEERLKKTYK